MPSDDGHTHEERYELRLTGDQLALLLRETFLSGELEDRLTACAGPGEVTVVLMDGDDIEELLGAIAAAANHAPNRKMQKALDALSEHVECALGMPVSIGDGLGDILDRMTALDPNLRALCLSPAQQFRLMEPWETDDPPVRLSNDLTLSDVQDAPFFHNARAILLAVAEQGGSVKATAAGNLNRSFVAGMLDQMRYSEGEFPTYRPSNKVVNEEDVHALHYPRVVLGLAQLLLRRKGQFTLTRKGREMLAEERAGELYALLFHTFFRRFNLAYADGMPELSVFQGTVGYCLYLFSFLAETWQPKERVESLLTHPMVAQAVQRDGRVHKVEWVVEMRFLRHIRGFGLLERRDAGKEGLLTLHELRKTELLDRFLSFDPGPH